MLPGIEATSESNRDLPIARFISFTIKLHEFTDTNTFLLEFYSLVDLNLKIEGESARMCNVHSEIDFSKKFKFLRLLRLYERLLYYNR